MALCKLEKAQIYDLLVQSHQKQESKTGSTDVLLINSKIILEW